MSFRSAMPNSHVSITFNELDRNYLWDGNHSNKNTTARLHLTFELNLSHFRMGNFCLSKQRQSILTIFQVQASYIVSLSLIVSITLVSCLNGESAISGPQYTWAINPAAFFEGFRINHSCTGISK